MRLPKRRDRDPLPVTGTQATMPNPTHIAANTMTTDSTATSSQGYPPSGFTMHGFPPFSAHAFPMQYPMPNYPTPMYAPPYGYPFVPQGVQAMQPNGYPSHAPQAPFMMQNYPMPNFPIPGPMYPPPSGYPFAMPAPQDANLNYGRNHQYSMSNAQDISNPVKYDLPNTDLSVCELLAASERDPTPEP